MKLPWDISEFDGSNATAYLQKYNLMAANCGLVGRAKLDRFSAYCAISIISEVESLSGYDNHDWNTFEASLKRYYFDKDPQRKEYQIPYLCSLAEKQKQKSKLDIKLYATQFKKIARVLVREGKLSPYSACMEFYGGLRDRIQEDVQRRLNIDWTNTAALDMDSILQEVINLENGKLDRQRFLHSTHSAHSEAAPTPTPSSEPKQEVNVAPPLPQEIRSAPVPKATPRSDNMPHIDDPTSLMERMSISMAEMANKNSRIDELTAQINKMSLDMANLNRPRPYSNSAQQYGPNQPRYGQNQQYGHNRQYGPNYGPNQYGQYDGPNQGGQYNYNRQYPGPPPRQFAPRQNFSNACSICGEEGHWRNDCATLSYLVQKGIVHIKDDRKIYLGRNGDRMVNKAGY